jgi:O-antigen/teichoic acid export membrane protein
VRFGAIFAARSDLGALRGTMELGLAVPLAISLVMGGGFILLSDDIATTIVGEPAAAPLIRVVGLLIPALVLNQQLAAILQGLRRIHLAVLAEQFTQQTLRMVLLGGLAFVGLTAERAIVASTMAAFAVTLLLTLFVRRSVHGLRRAASTRDTGAVIRFSLPVYFSNIVNTLGGNLQTLLLGTMSSLTSVGVFSVAGHVQLIGSIFHSAVVSSSMPVFAALHDRQDRGGMTRLYQTTSRWTLTLNLPFFLAALLFPEFLLSIFGEEFRAGALALVILACGNVVNAATGSSGAVLDMSGHTGVKLINATISVGLALILNLLLIPPLGIVGAAIAAAAAVGVVNLLRIAEVRILVGVHPYHRDYYKPLLAALLAAAGALAAASLTRGLGEIASAGIGLIILAVTYAIAMIALGLSSDDRFVLGRIRNRLFRRRIPKPARIGDESPPRASGPEMERPE